MEIRESSKRQKQEPHVGIFWVVGDKLLIDSTALAEAEQYGDNLTHPRGHVEVWEQFQQRGLVLPEVEYEENARGRVMFYTKTKRFILLADKCILRDKDVIKKILSQLNLPSDSEMGMDEHYRWDSPPNN